ncbi:hypothetical protein LJC68_05320 [Bacteroidales bacterium OttesenSCG-928-B11]|nr:hypothetical protein [Bacteroidales bacterium OttesenSCG-928-B11]MDL2326362.1 hypothetical protein [Bacteroidales bacterium OttesenSCG-928-A14]
MKKHIIIICILLGITPLLSGQSQNLKSFFDKLADNPNCTFVYSAQEVAYPNDWGEEKTWVKRHSYVVRYTEKNSPEIDSLINELRVLALASRLELTSKINTKDRLNEVYLNPNKKQNERVSIIHIKRGGRQLNFFWNYDEPILRK